MKLDKILFFLVNELDLISIFYGVSGERAIVLRTVRTYFGGRFLVEVPVRQDDKHGGSHSDFDLPPRRHQSFQNHSADHRTRRQNIYIRRIMCMPIAAILKYTCCCSVAPKKRSIAVLIGQRWGLLEELPWQWCISVVREQGEVKVRESDIGIFYTGRETDQNQEKKRTPSGLVRKYPPGALRKRDGKYVYWM